MVVYENLHRILLRRAAPDGKIERRRLFEIVAERIGRVQEQDKPILIREFEKRGIILSSDKFSFVLKKV